MIFNQKEFALKYAKLLPPGPMKRLIQVIGAIEPLSQNPNNIKNTEICKQIDQQITEIYSQEGEQPATAKQP